MVVSSQSKLSAGGQFDYAADFPSDFSDLGGDLGSNSIVSIVATELESRQEFGQQFVHLISVNEPLGGKVGGISGS